MDNKKESIKLLQDFLEKEEIDMSIQNHQKIALDALKKIDTDKIMSEKSKVIAKFSILVTYRIIDSLIKNLKENNIYGEMDIRLTVDKNLSVFKTETSTVQK